MSKTTDKLEKEIVVLKDAVADLQLVVKSIDHDLQATKRERPIE